MKILITGCAGFIGYHLSKRLLEKNIVVFGIDNMNNYYDINLKKRRLNILKKYKNFYFYKIDLSNKKKLLNIFKNNKFKTVVNLAAQAGVRFSLKNPEAYLHSNIVGFFNILESCKICKVKNLLFASSSSVYGNNIPPFKETMKTDSPLQFYAATKKSNEVMAHAYSKLYKMNCIGLRFFTVYGPFGRPDMAIYNFVNQMYRNKTISIFNKGNHQRDFTYIDDVVTASLKLIDYTHKLKKPFYDIFNVGNGKTEELKKIIFLLEKELNLKAKKKYISLQTGDIKETNANISKLVKVIKFRPKTNIEKGIKVFVEWFKEYYKKK
jgi:UDP-glucuronate 4-epimerase